MIGKPAVAIHDWQTSIALEVGRLEQQTATTRSQPTYSRESAALGLAHLPHSFLQTRQQSQQEPARRWGSQPQALSAGSAAPCPRSPRSQTGSTRRAQAAAPPPPATPTTQ